MTDVQLVLLYADERGQERRCTIEQLAAPELALLSDQLGSYLWPSRIPPLEPDRWRLSQYQPEETDPATTNLRTPGDDPGGANGEMDGGTAPESDQGPTP
jgi:hypothetical protein